MTANPYEQHLDKTPANYQPLTPLTLLERSAAVYPDHVAVIHGKQRMSYAQLYDRSRRLASALAQRYIGPGDTVTVMLPNVPAMLEAHYGVPMTGAVLHSLNTRLDPAIIAFQLDHANTKVLITDREFSSVMQKALAQAKVKPLIIDFDDPEYPQTGEPLSYEDYEGFLAKGHADFKWRMPADEWEAIALNYTSGTTGNPKGVVYHHRGAGLMCYANTISTGMQKHPVYLWTLPMFHCNGWCFPWSIATVAGTHVCLRWVRPKAMYDLITEHNVTHMCGAPIVMATLLNAPEAEKKKISHKVQLITAGAPPPASLLGAMSAAGFNVTHVYGLTETYGPAVVNEWKDVWDALPPDDRAQKQARQGVRYPTLEALTVMDPITMQVVPADGQTMGEVMFRGNNVMKGYLKNPQATEESFHGGWVHSGDLGVLHPDGYIQLKDRSKDIIISGGENISSIEVEDVLYRHPAVLEAAVVGRPDEKWGEIAIAFVKLKDAASATEAEIIEFVRSQIAKYKAPKQIVFGELPKTSTGKVQKFKLRDQNRPIGA